MEPIRLFRSEAFGSIRITGTPERPLFLASDVAGALGYSNQRDAVIRHCKGVVKRDTPTTGGPQLLSYIPESDVYRLVMRSKLPQAEAFQDWVMEEILPSIRRTGGYLVATPNETPEQIMARALLVANETITRMKEQMEVQAPRILFATAVETSQTSVLVADLAKILTQNGFEIGQNRLFRTLREQGYLGKSGTQFNRPTQRAMEMGLFEIKQTSITKPNGTTLVSITPKVTGKGQIYFVNHFLKSVNVA